jgi:glyoxylase-like metal-dependent hydrolase (beta-lactamase superfamily II)
MKIYPMLLGDFDVNSKVPFRDGDYSKNVIFCCYAFYVEDNEDKIIVDTGFGDAQYCLKHLGRKIRTSSTIPLEAHLKNIDVSPEDITAVVLTHCHWDHIGGIGLFSNTKIYCQRNELSWAIAPQAWISEAYPSSFSHLLIDARERLVLLDGDFSLGERILLKKLSGGHSPGSQVVEIKGDSKDVIIAGDELFYFDNLNKSIPNGENFSLYETITALRYFQNRVVEKPGTIVIPGHDPKLWQMYKNKWIEGF